MTVTSTVSAIKYIADGQTKEYSVPFRFLANPDGSAQLAVYISGNDLPLTQTDDYTVSGCGNVDGGSVTFAHAPEKDKIVAIIRDIPATQETQFIEGAKFPAIAFEQILDKIMMLIQALQECVSRCLVLSPTDSESSKSIKDQLLEQITEINEAVGVASTAVANATNAATDAAESAASASADATNALIWAEGTDEQIQELGGTHSAKGWVEQINTNVYQKLENVEIPPSAWQSSSVSTDYAYEASYTVNGLTDDNIIDVYFNEADATSGNYSPVTSTTSGKFTIYAKEAPEENVVLPSVLIF